MQRLRRFAYLGQCGVPLEAPYWIGHLQQLYAGAFDARKARETFERIAAAVRKEVPSARALLRRSRI